MDIKAPFLPFDRVRQIADSFLDTHHVDRRIPVPIEQIIEFDFGISIIPIPGILKSYDVDASISSDLSTIYVDESIYLTRERRYRFSIAHELAHCVLHAEIFMQLRFDSIAEWKRIVSAIPERQYGFIEQQAYNFAGLVLVPSNRLKDEFDRADDEAAAAGIELRDLDERGRRSIEDSIGRAFNVSGEVIRRRLKRDGRW